MFGHEAAAVTLIGIILSFVLFKLNGQKIQSIIQFNDEIFFYAILPPLVFASGFNMPRKRFF